MTFFHWINRQPANRCPKSSEIRCHRGPTNLHEISHQHISYRRNLPSALSHLDDDQLGRLVGAVKVELERRGKKAPIRQTIERKPPAEDGTPPLAFGKLNAIRAAFKAGVKPSAIAKQFGISQADVRRALKNDDFRR